MKGNFLSLVEIISGIVILSAAIYKADLLTGLIGVCLLAAGFIHSYMGSRFYKRNSNRPSG